MVKHNGPIWRVWCKSPDEFKTWSQNLGHEQILTTFGSDGQVASTRQREMIRDVVRPKRGERTDVEEIAKAVVREMAAQSASETKTISRSDCVGATLGATDKLSHSSLLLFLTSYEMFDSHQPTNCMCQELSFPGGFALGRRCSWREQLVRQLNFLIPDPDIIQ